MALELWQEELKNSVRTLEELERFAPGANREALRGVVANMRLAITPHSLALIDFTRQDDPLLRIAVPHEDEIAILPEELRDPIGDEAKSPVPFLTHRYPDRVLVYATFFCSTYCRFCFRRFKTGSATPGPGRDDRARIAEYLRAYPEVEEAILTGGDPLTLGDAQIEEWLAELRAIPSVRRIRIHTRVPVNLPSRITENLLEIFKKYMDATHPIFVVTHFNHPREIAPENIRTIAALVDAGIVVRNQSVLLRGVNDDAAILETLFKKLADIRVVPYYLHQLDLARGTNHFRVPIERGIEIMKQLQGKVTGIALPKYMLDIPGGKGKIPLAQEYARREDDGSWTLESPFGEQASYREPGKEKPIA